MAAERIKHSLRMLAALGSAAADPTLLSALRSGPDAHDALRALAAEPPPAVARLADELAVEAHPVFATKRDLPTDADVLYGQMVEIGLVAAPEFVTAEMNANAVTEAMVSKLSAPEHLTAPMLSLFRALTTQVLARIFADNIFADDLRAAFMREVLRRLGDLGNRLDEVGRLTRLEMVALADQFEIERIYELSDAKLREALEQRAEDYRDYKRRIEAIDDRTAGLGNLKAAAREAVDRVDFDEVEALLSHIDEVETEIGAESKVLRAENALMRGRAEDAFRMLSAAADAFGSVRWLEPARRRLAYHALLRNHGRRYGGTGLALAERMVRDALVTIPQSAA